MGKTSQNRMHYWQVLPAATVR